MLCSGQVGHLVWIQKQVFHKHKAKAHHRKNKLKLRTAPVKFWQSITREEQDFKQPLTTKDLQPCIQKGTFIVRVLVCPIM